MTDAWADRARGTSDWNSPGKSESDVAKRLSNSMEVAVDAFATLVAQRLAEVLEPIILRVGSQLSGGREQLPPTMSVSEAAEYLGLGRDAVYAAVHSGELPSLKISRRIRIPTQALLKKLDSLAQ